MIFYPMLRADPKILSSTLGQNLKIANNIYEQEAPKEGQPLEVVQEIYT